MTLRMPAIAQNPVPRSAVASALGRCKGRKAILISRPDEQQQSCLGVTPGQVAVQLLQGAEIVFGPFQILHSPMKMWRSPTRMRMPVLPVLLKASPTSG